MSLSTHTRSEFFYALCLIAITLFSLFRLPWFTGYDVFTGDQVFYLIPVLHSLNPGLFHNDLLSSPSYTQASLSFFTEWISFTVDTFKGHVLLILFALSALVRFIYFSSIFLTTRFLSKNNLLSIVAVFLLINTEPSIVSLATTNDPLLLPRVMAIALGIASFYFLLRQRWLLSGLAVSTALILHPISALVFLVTYFSVLIYNLTKGTPHTISIYTGLLMPLVFLGWYGSQISLETGVFSVLNLSQWNALGLHADLFSLLAHPLLNYLGTYYLIADTVLFGITLYEIHRGVLRESGFNFFWCLGVMLLPLAFSVVEFIFSDAIHFTLITQLQLSRSFFVWGLVLPIEILFLLKAIDARTRSGLWMSLSLIGILFNDLFSVDSYYHLLSETYFIGIFVISWMWYRGWLKAWNSAIEPGLSMYSLVGGGLAIAIALRAHHVGATAFFILSILAAGIFAFLSSLFHDVMDSQPFIPNILLSIGAIIVIILLMVTLLITHAYEPSYSEDPSFSQLCSWLKGHVPENALSLTEPFSNVVLAGEVRMSCGTELLMSQGDGNSGVYNNTFFREWLHKKDFVLSELSTRHNLTEGVRAIAHTYQVKYLITQVRLPDPGLQLLFTNGNYFVYSMNPR